MKWIGMIAGALLSAGIGSRLDPSANNISAVVAIVTGAALLGLVIGAIADREY